MHPKANQNDQHGAKSEPKGSQSEPKNLQKHQLRDRFEKVEILIDSRDKKREHFSSENHIKTLNFMPKWCQNSAKTDAQTHQKSMPKLVKKKIIKVIKIHVFQNGVKSFKFILKNNGFKGFAGCVRERKRYQQKTSTMIHKIIPKSMNEDNAKSVIEKVMQQIQSIIKS